MTTPNSVYSLCKCGCGKPTSIARKTSKRDGTVKGLPVPYVPGHQFRKPRIDFSGTVPFKIEGEYCKLIDLADGYFTVVSAHRHSGLSVYTWTKRWNPRTKSFYASRHDESDPFRRIIPMQREILGLRIGDPEKGDHINRNTLDNRDSNLRVATNQENGQNAKRKVTNTSGYKGVHFHAGKWQARICVNRERISLGHYASPEDAHEAYKRAALIYHGEFACFS
jgi:hypothetical protein